jgi:hypothetical protein
MLYGGSNASLPQLSGPEVLDACIRSRSIPGLYTILGLCTTLCVKDKRYFKTCTIHCSAFRTKQYLDVGDLEQAAAFHESSEPYALSRCLGPVESAPAFLRPDSSLELFITVMDITQLRPPQAFLPLFTSNRPVQHDMTSQRLYICWATAVAFLTWFCHGDKIAQYCDPVGRITMLLAEIDCLMNLS